MPSRTVKNRYSKRARVSERQIRALVRCFAADLTALQTAQLSGLNRNTVNRLYRGLRDRLQAACEAQRPLFGVVEVDESWFGARNIRGKRGRGAYGKTIVFGIFERAGQVSPRSCQTAPEPPCKALSGGVSMSLPSSTPMAGAATTAWSTSATATCASTTETTSSPRARCTSTASKASGASPRSGSPSSKGCPNTPFISISRRPSALQQPTCQQVQDAASLAAK